MYGNRDQMRRVFIDVRDKLGQGRPLEPMEARIADVLQLHPEYDPLLSDPERALGAEFDADSGQSNPFLHLAMHLSLREQAQLDRPPGIRAIHQRLCGRMGIHEAEHAMMECLGQVLWQAQRDGRPPDEQAFLECLRKTSAGS